MNVASCPRCHQMVVVPEAVDEAAWVRCPLCQAEFSGSEVLDQLPPRLILLDRPPSPSSDPSAAGADAADDVRGGLDATPRRPPGAPDAAPCEASPPAPPAAEAPLFDFQPPADDRRAASPRAARGPSSRPPRKLLIELAKIAAGGAVGCALAVLLLWWTVKADPFQLGPAVGRFVPWAVPAALRGGGLRPLIPPPPPVSDRQAAREEDSPAAPRATASPDEDPRGPGPPVSTRAAPPPSESGSASAPSGESGADRSMASPPPIPSPPPIELSTGKEADSSARRGAAAAVLVGVRNAPRRTADDLKRALQRVRGAGDAWAASQYRSAETRSELADNLFQSLARLGEVITFLRPDEPESRSYVEQMQRLLLDVADLPGLAELVGARAARWIQRKDRSHRGVVLVARVASIRSLGPLYETRFQLLGPQPRLVSVMSRVDPADDYGPGDRVLMLGVIVEAPEETLAGYQGNEPMVIMGGYPLVLPDHEPADG